MEPTIKTRLTASQIDGRRIRYTAMDGSITDVEAMLEADAQPDGTIKVVAVSPYDITVLGNRPLQVKEYGTLTQ